MGTNNPYLPDTVRSDEEAIQYLATVLSAVKNNTYTQLSGAGPFTLTGTQMVGGVVEFSGSTTAVTVNTATAAAILAAMQVVDPNAGVGSTIQLTLVNDNTSSGAITVAGGTGVTLSGPTATTIAIAAAKRYLIKILTATTASMVALN